MAGITGSLTAALVARLTASADGVNARVGAIEGKDQSIQGLGIRTILTVNVSTDVSERAGHAHYPALLVYCDKLTNTLKEKFRSLSGKAHMVVEVRHSQEKLDAIEVNLQAYVDAICALLDESRGDWGGGAFYAGGYDVGYDPVIKGGKNFLQKAKVGFDVEVSR